MKQHEQGFCGFSVSPTKVLGQPPLTTPFSTSLYSSDQLRIPLSHYFFLNTKRERWEDTCKEGQGRYQRIYIPHTHTHAQRNKLRGKGRLRQPHPFLAPSLEYIFSYLLLNSHPPSWCFIFPSNKILHITLSFPAHITSWVMCPPHVQYKWLRSTVGLVSQRGFIPSLLLRLSISLICLSPLENISFFSIAQDPAPFLEQSSYFCNSNTITK